jgi:uncharacterized membrane protein
VSWYSLLKLVHILAAIAAVGTNVTYFVWLARIKGQPRPEQAVVLGGIKALDARLANPAYGILPLTGVGMVLVGDIPFSTFWVALAIGLYVAVGVIAGMLFSPALRRQVELVANAEVGSDAYSEAARRTTMFGAITMLPIAAILYLMVIKPTP